MPRLFSDCSITSAMVWSLSLANLAAWGLRIYGGPSHEASILAAEGGVGVFVAVTVLIFLNRALAQRPIREESRRP
jgi:hypothetical protein